MAGISSQKDRTNTDDERLTLPWTPKAVKNTRFHLHERREKSSRESANGALNTDWHSKRYIIELLSTLEYTRAQ